jgi:hypothetical protein
MAASTSPSASVEGPVRGLQMEIQAALVAPALQFDHAIALPHRVPLQERQPAGFREQIDEHHGLVIDFEIVGTDDLPEQFVSDIGPRGLQREIVVDLTRHALS